MGKTACVHSWREDPAVSGDQRLVPVTCRGVIESLEGLVVALHRGSMLDLEQARLLRDISAREQYGEGKEAQRGGGEGRAVP